MTALLTFPLPLLRLTLCGGAGLPSAWGPLVNADDGEYVAWNPDDQIAMYDAGRGEPPYLWRPLTLPSLWSMPLGADHPWAARLAVIAAWMLGRSGVGVWIGDNDVFLTLNIATVRNTFIQMAWHRSTGRHYHGSVPAPNLPTLPTHLAAHPPVVALLLALYDVPEIRSRVDAVRP